MVGHPTSFDELNPLQVVSVHQNWSSTLNQSIKHRWCAGVGGHYSFWLWPAACSGGFSGTCTALRQRQSSCSPSMSTSRTHKRAGTTQD